MKNAIVWALTIGMALGGTALATTAEIPPPPEKAEEPPMLKKPIFNIAACPADMRIRYDAVLNRLQNKDRPELAEDGLLNMAATGLPLYANYYSSAFAMHNKDDKDVPDFRNGLALNCIYLNHFGNILALNLALPEGNMQEALDGATIGPVKKGQTPVEINEDIPPLVIKERFNLRTCPADVIADFEKISKDPTIAPAGGAFRNLLTAELLNMARAGLTPLASELTYQEARLSKEIFENAEKTFCDKVSHFSLKLDSAIKTYNKEAFGKESGPAIESVPPIPGAPGKGHGAPEPKKHEI